VDRPEVEQVEAGVSNAVTSFVSMEASESERPELTSAKIIVSGGRALGSSDQFHALIDPLADKLGAAVGAKPRGGRRRLCAQRLSGRPDRQDRRSGAVRRGRHLGRDPAPRGHEGQQGHRCHQQGRGSPIFQIAGRRPGRRLFKLVPELTRSFDARYGAGLRVPL
jgi:electron transfer flavoprotein alpha subunit